MNTALEATTADSEVPVAFLVGVGVVALAFAIVVIAGTWKMFRKAGRPGWAAIIPFFSQYTLLKTAGKPGWWLILLFIPVVNVVILVLTYASLSRSFGKGVGFTVGLFFLSFVFIPILGFGKARYPGPGGDTPGGYAPR